MGLDLGDRVSHYCLIDEAGRKVEEGEVRTQIEIIRHLLARNTRLRVVIESGTHSRWVEAIIREEGHEAIVANPRKVRLISHNAHKGDRKDGELLARLGRMDPELLFPIVHRSEAVQRDRALLKARDQLVRTRTQLILHIRGTVKSFGDRLPRCSSEAFSHRVRGLLPVPLESALEPLLGMIEQMTQRIRDYDREIERTCRQRYPQTERLRQVRGVGPVTALAFVTTLEDPRQWRRSRDVRPYLGLTPRRDQSGNQDPQLRITKAGDGFTRRLLIGSAHYILGPFGTDCDLRRFGERIASRRGKNAKRRAVVAVARKLAILLHHLWVTGKTYDPHYAHKLRLSQVA
jgi:transposase